MIGMYHEIQTQKEDSLFPRLSAKMNKNSKTQHKCNWRSNKNCRLKFNSNKLCQTNEISSIMGVHKTLKSNLKQTLKHLIRVNEST